MTLITIAQALDACTKDLRVCPQPTRWLELYELLERHAKMSNVSAPARPLILGAWWEASDADKRQRLKQQVSWAAEQQCLEEVTSMLSSLSESDWSHADR
jgi:hypothetical protein